MMRQFLVFFILSFLSNGVLCADVRRIPENAPRPISIGVSVFVTSISKINDQTNTFEAILDLQLSWKDSSLAFDVHKMGTNRLIFNHDEATKKLETIWSPKLILANATVQGMEHGVFINADGTVVFIQRMKGIFDSKYQLDAFPFDTQNLKIRIASEEYKTNQIILSQGQRDINNSGLGQDVSLSGWNAKKITFVRSFKRGWDGQYFPEMHANIVITRQPATHLFTILIPFFLVMLIPTIGTLYMNTEVDKRLGYWSSSILALVALSFTYSARYATLPPDAIIMQLIVIGSAYQIVMILLSVTLFNSQNTDGWFSNKFIVPEIINYLRFAIPIALVGLVVTRILLTSLI